MKNIIILTAILIALTSASSAQIHSVQSGVKANDPVFFLGTGTSFGSYMQILYKTGKFDEMIKFTSSKTLAKFGKDKVLSFYKEMGFAYTMKLKSQNISGDTTILNYEAGIMATKNMIRMNVVIENDTCKLVLHNLKKI